jgi:thymidylate synthase
MIVSAWNPEQIADMALPPCHWSFQFHCEETAQREIQGSKKSPRYTLNCLVNMRSADIALGVPFNIASYALLTHMVAHCVGMRPGRLVIMMADCHVYTNHIEPAATQLARVPRQFPTLKFRGVAPGGDIDQFARGGIDTVEVCGYSPHPAVKYPMVV